MKSFFEKHRHELTLKMQSGRQKGFRVCQLGAVWAAKSHFTASSSRALINLPTGAGKTAVMMTLAFEFGARRVFVLTPSIFIREQIAAEFRSLRQLIQDIGALPRKFEPRLEVCEVLNELQSAADWKDLLKFDVVVATPNVVRAGEPPSELFVSPEAGASGFDLVFIDEAHHSAAQTWSEFLHLTRDARTILFTATPFRRDRKRIHAELIYTYPISKAIRDGIYRPVRYVPVDEPDRQRRHTRLAEACAAELFQIRKKDPTATFIAKAERIADMDGLLATYKAAGFDGSRIDVVHSEKSADHNRQVLKRVAANKGTKRDEGGLDGFICVDSGSEGIDVGTLRIAVFHDTPRTLPYTIQIIGRITRRNHDRFGDAVLIADPRVARGTDVHDLYYSDPAGWNDLLPQLFEDYVMRSKFSPFPGTVFAGVASIPADDLSPYLAVRVYQRLSASRASGSPLADSLSEDALRTQDTDVILFDKEEDRVVVITRTWTVPQWTSNRSFETERFDLHIYLYTKSLLFESTTSERVAAGIRSKLLDGGSFRRAGYEVIRNGLSDADGGHYYVLGMVKQSGAGSGIPQYKMLMGEDVQDAVKFADGRSFGAGHAVMTKDGDTRGIAIHSSRIWSNRRKSLDDFRAWCEALARLILQPGQQIPQVEGKLMEKEVIERYPDNVEVLSILFDTSLWRSQKFSVVVAGTPFPDPICRFSDWRLAPSRDSMTAKLTVAGKDSTAQTHPLTLRHSFAHPHWRMNPTEDVVVDIDYGDRAPAYSVSLDEYLNDFPPLIVLTSGATIRDELLFKPRIQSQRIDPEVIEAQDWSDTDITKEAKPPDPKYRVNVQDRTVELIRDQYILGTGDMLVCDDRANEVADFVLFQGGMRKRVTFFHCKYKKSDGDSRRPEPGVRKGDLVELTDQAVRTGHWIGADNLGKRLSERIGGDTKLMIHGTVRQLQQLAASFAPDEWSYAVVIVQPGLHRKQLLGRANPSQCEQLLTVIYDRIVTDYGARFSVWTS